MRILTDEEIIKLGGNPKDYEKALVYWGESHINQYFFNEVAEKMYDRGLEDFNFHIKLVGEKKDEIVEKIENHLHSLDFSGINEVFDDVFSDIFREEGFKADMEIPTATLVIDMYGLKEEDIEMKNNYKLRVNDTYPGELKGFEE